MANEGSQAKVTIVQTSSTEAMRMSLARRSSVFGFSACLRIPVFQLSRTRPPSRRPRIVWERIVFAIRYRLVLRTSPVRIASPPFLSREWLRRNESRQRQDSAIRMVPHNQRFTLNSSENPRSAWTSANLAGSRTLTRVRKFADTIARPTSAHYSTHRNSP